MIVYKATKKEFTQDVFANSIADKILSVYQKMLGRTTSSSEISSWKNSMQYMNNILLLSKIPDNTGVSIEYKIPQSSKRIDFIVTGKDEQKDDIAIIVELKQWSNVKKTQKDAVVRTYIGSGEREIEHPSYQAWTYAALLEDFNEAIRKDSIQLKPCAYLHNCESYDVINHSFYHQHTSKAPSFLKRDSARLSDFIRNFIKYGDSDKIMYRIENGKIKPSKNLADKLESLLSGNPEFLMIDDQKVVYETVLYTANQCTAKNEKHVIIVDGGPGTGKSVIAINLLVELTRRRLVAQYVTKNAAPRTVYESKLTGTFTRTHIGNLFKSSGDYTSCEENVCDVLIVDEAHRLNEKSGFYQNLGENQIKEIIQTAKLSIFFIDEKQQVTYKDIGDKIEICSWAEELNVEVQEMKLSSQFRCNGSDIYLSWIDYALQIEETFTEDLGRFNYEFQVLDSPHDLKDIIYRKNKYNNKARLVAGYCWNWITKKKSAPDLYDIEIKEHNFEAKWNLANDGNLWILKPESVSEIGCIHTCQGLELDYIGVIIGPDLICRDGRLLTVPEKRARTDASLNGYKKQLKTNPDSARQKADRLIRNTYRTLMTRGQKGCYIFCTDAETNEYFKNLSQKFQAPIEEDTTNTEDIKIRREDKYPGLPFPLLDRNEVKPFINAVPIYDLQNNTEPSAIEKDTEKCDWISLPAYLNYSPNLFVIQVIGNSMNKRITNGAWCLFEKSSEDECQGQIVLAYHPEIYDEDLGGKFTVKKFSCEKLLLGDNSREYRKIVLEPDTTSPGYEKFIISDNESDEFKIIGKFIVAF